MEIHKVDIIKITLYLEVCDSEIEMPSRGNFEGVIFYSILFTHIGVFFHRVTSYFNIPAQIETVNSDTLQF